MSTKTKAVYLVVCVMLLCFLFTPVLSAKEASTETPQQKEQRMQWWRDARFGLFVHWGPVSLTGYEIGWSRQTDPNKQSLQV
jgi:alpha-L-fucosidase